MNPAPRVRRRSGPCARAGACVDRNRPEVDVRVRPDETQAPSSRRREERPVTTRGHDVLAHQSTRVPGHALPPDAHSLPAGCGIEDGISCPRRRHRDDDQALLSPSSEDTGVDRRATVHRHGPAIEVDGRIRMRDHEQVTAVVRPPGGRDVDEVCRQACALRHRRQLARVEEWRAVRARYTPTTCRRARPFRFAPRA